MQHVTGSRMHAMRVGQLPARASTLPVVQHFRISASKHPVQARLAPVQALRPHVIMFLDSAGEGVKLPLQPQQLLGLKAGEVQKDSIINQIYDELIMAPVEPGYSQQTVSGRAELLDIVRNDIITSKGRTLDKREVNIPYDLIPGALALMAEVGQDEVVMYLGQQLLSSGELDAYMAVKQDVLLSMALSKCNMAREVFATGNQIATGCRHLEEALQLLQPIAPGEPALAPELAREIKSSLAELRSQCALEQVSAPIMKDQQDVRKRAVRTIRELLRQPEVDVLSARNRGAAANASSAPAPVNQEFVGKLMQQLTCEEIVHLTEWESIAKNPGPYKWVYHGLLERVAIGHILTGFSQCQPAYVKMAINILKQLPNSADVLVMQGVCQVLLGSVQTSVDLLKQAEDMGSRAGARDTTGISDISARAYSFVVKNTPAGDDGLLPGLCMFTELWLAKVALPLFRDTVASPPSTSLVKYFDDARVETLITVYDEKGDAITDSLSSALGQLKRAVSRGLSIASSRDSGLETSSLLETGNKKMVITGVAAAFVLGIAGLSTLFGGRSNAQALSHHGAKTTTASYKTAESKQFQPVVTASGELDVRSAEQLVRQWQEAKQQALGPNHNGEALPIVLAEPVLGEMRAKVANFQQEGWFMRYKLQRVKVTDMEAGSRGTVNLTAQLDESASLYGADGRQADGYKSTYAAEYQVVQAKDGSWKVSKVTVQGQDPNFK